MKSTPTIQMALPYAVDLSQDAFERAFTGGLLLAVPTSRHGSGLPMAALRNDAPPRGTPV